GPVANRANTGAPGQLDLGQIEGFFIHLVDNRVAEVGGANGKGLLVARCEVVSGADEDVLGLAFENDGSIIEAGAALPDPRGARISRVGQRPFSEVAGDENGI